MRPERCGIKPGVLRLIRVGTLAVAVGFCCLCAFLYFGDLRRNPGCIVRQITGYDCPACGTQRALVALLYGAPKKAFLYNPYLVFISPYLLAVALSVGGSGRGWSRLRRVLYDWKTVSFFAGLMIVWWILRNTSVWAEIACEAGI